MSWVRTVLGDVDAGDLGRTYAHEHLIIDNALIAAVFPHILLDDVDAAVREVGDCRAVGIDTFVDAMPCAAGRDAVRLAQIARRTGCHIIAATGLHHERYYGPRHWTAILDVGELAELFVADIETGIDAFDYTGPVVRRSPHRAGVVKIATDAMRIVGRDLRLVEAAAIAHLRTGAPVLTHCEQGRGGLEQVEALAGFGVPADAIILSHVDKVADLTYHRALARTGAFLEYDQALRTAGDLRPLTASLIVALQEGGFGRQILLGTDGARRSLWRSLGGEPGLAWLGREFPGTLTRCGVSAETIEAVFTTNAAVALAMRPVR